MLAVMLARGLTVAGVTVTGASVGVVVAVLIRPDAVTPGGVAGAMPQWWNLVVPLTWTATGAVLRRMRPGNAVGTLLLLVGTCQALSTAAVAYGMYGRGVADPHWPLADWIAFLGGPLWVPGVLPMITVLIAIYPEGHLADRGRRLATAAALIGLAMLTVAMTGSYHDVAPGRPPLLIHVPRFLLDSLAVVMIACLAGGTLALWTLSLLRVWHARSPERQQLAWLLFAVTPLFVLLMSVRSPAFAVFSTLVPLAMGIGIMRYHMYDVELVLRRGFVYATLSAIVIGTYLLTAAVAGSALDHGVLPGVLAAALVAVCLAPLRERVQRELDRLVYGDRRDPMRAVGRVGDSVTSAEDPAGLLAAVLVTITDAVRAPGAAVRAPDGLVVAGYGLGFNSSIGGIDLPLCVSGRDVGTLHVVGRRGHEPFTAGDRRLLGALAPQVAVVVTALELSESLEAERDRVVRATRAERDRLRRDLHDGLGPSLSGVALGLQALELALAARDDATVADLLERVRAEGQTAIADVRRILDDLRPAALDDVGLGAAMRRHTDTIVSGVLIKLDVPAELPPLLPEVEAAAYRVAQEGLTNVVRHAGASSARVVVAALENDLRVEVIDDGHGFTRPRADGVGLASMRHRVEVLGGTFDLTSDLTGTRIVASLPMGGV